MSPVDIAISVFHGKAPRFFNRMLRGDPRAWSDASRAQRAEIQAALKTVGLEMRLVTKTYFSLRAPQRPGRRHLLPGAEHQVGEIVPCP